MFAGGMAIGVPSFMPQAIASDTSISDGTLSVSSEFIQGAAILEIVVNDPDNSATDTDINNGPEVTIGGSDYTMNQAVNGKWYLYVVDQSSSKAVDDNANIGMEFGVHCDTGLGVSENTSNTIIPTGTDVWAEVIVYNAESTGASLRNGGCFDADGMTGTLDDASNTVAREKLSDAVLQAAPTLSDHDDNANDLGQRGHALNASGYGSWPYILSIELSDDNIIEYGNDMVNVEFGNTDDEASISLTNQSPAGGSEIHLIITDPALNIDPTAADIWTFDLSETKSSSTSVIFANNGSNTEMSAAHQAEHACEDNCQLTSDSQSVIAGATSVSMTESHVNSAVFESFDLNGSSQISVKQDAAADTVTVFDYAGETVDMIITYNDASITLDAGGDWLPTGTATVTITDPDMNKNPTSQDELLISDETMVVPTIKMGNPLTLAGGTNANLEKGDANNVAGVTIGEGSPGTEGASDYTLAIYNTTDNSERLRIQHQAEAGNTAAATSTWINVTTGHTHTQLVNLPGTVVLSYNIEGPAGDMSSTDVNVYLTTDGNNSTDHAGGVIGVIQDGNTRAGVFDLDDGDQFLKNRDISVNQTWTPHSSHTGSNFVTIAFEITHAAGNDLAATADYAISADFCNFDQNNGSGTTHNCIYRIEAEETGDNTGVFEGTVEYVNLNNSTAGGAISGEHNGNDHEVESILSDMGNDGHALVVLQDSVDGSDAIRVIYNDTDALQASDEIGAQLDTSTYTGTVDLDLDTYEADDMATITIVDADLNQDSGIRDTYQNSSTTFQVTMTGSDGVAHYPFSADMTIIETSADSGVFQATFTVPDYNGQDMEVTYYESRDAGGNTVEYYDIATITSNSGSVSFDRSVYPVPFATGELHEGDDSTDYAVDGNVTITVTVADADFTGDTLTTTSTTGTGTIVISLIEGTTTSTCFTAGSTVAAFGDDDDSLTVEELGPLSEIVRDSSEYEVEFQIEKLQHCGSNMRTVSSGDVIQVKYVDASDDNGSSTDMFDSSTFDLRTGSLSVDKDVYVLGSDMVITLTDPDLNLDAGSIETYSMALIEWDSDADGSEGMDHGNNFTNNPSELQETGDDTGVFQTVTTLPEDGIYNDNNTGNTIQTIDFGEAVTLTYADQSLAGEDQVGDDSLDVEAYFSISNFGALIELDKAVYNWTDTVYVTITAPDHNTNTASEETVGTTALPIQVTTRNGKMCTTSTGSTTYVAAESGPDTGVFEAEIALEGYALAQAHNTPSQGDACSATDDTAGEIQTAGQTDGISVSYEYNDGSVVVASASVVFNIAEASFDTSAASAGGSAVFTVVDPDENTDSDVIDTFLVSIFSDSDNGGFKLTMNETNEDTGVFEGTVFFTTDAATSGTNLRVSEGDTVTAEYDDMTLPEPYTDSDDLTIAGTLTIGTAFPPLERAPAANARVVDAFGASVAEVTVDQQVQIAADVSNGQSKDQAFAYLVQVQDGNGVTVSLAWITGSLTAGQSMSPALSWTPDASGSYTATVFVWESVDNPTALSPTTSVDIDVV
jgi:hypothetical protein